MVDADKPMVVQVPQTVMAPDTFITRAGLTAMILAVQEISTLLDGAEENPEWRLDVYRNLFRILMTNNHSGTGSEEEKKVLNALALLAQALGVVQEEHPH